MKSMMTLVALVAAAGSAQAANVAYWAFQTAVPASNANYLMSWPIAADAKANAGLATLDTDALKWDGTASGATALQQGSMQFFTGSSVNLQPGFVAGSELSMRSLSGAANGKSIILRFDASNFSDLIITLSERSTSTGANAATVSVSTDGTNYTAAGGYAITNDSAYRLRTIDLSAFNSIENSASVYVKLTYSGFSATSSTGNIRQDNILVSGTFIPAPGSMALLAIGGVVAGRRRRA